MSSIRESLWADFSAGSRLACARLISAVENDPEALPEILDRVLPAQKGGLRIGVTGPPGVGKSTVTGALARRAVRAGRRVGVLAVDPTSPFSGGAFLGDRVRMQDLDGGRVFIRSMASRDGHGGLSPATPYAADVLDAFGLDRIFIETVGVGQAELDVLGCADLVVLVLQPATGDVIQALKAGIIEAADLFLVNKADLQGTETLLESLRFLMDISPVRKDRPFPPVLEASALQDRGMDEVYEETERLICACVESGRYRDKRRARLEQEIRSAIERELWSGYAALTGAEGTIRAAAAELAASGGSPYPFIREACARIRIHLDDERTGRG
ncbi:MAG TPA: methylmalonyl Co-A mutase-associated GTPase MeaB [Acidobacteriota bacterium]|nr:methylmalonyl Co-A mutase-associated GTPase MeaB [Acidobacteriota bacterium]